MFVNESILMRELAKALTDRNVHITYQSVLESFDEVDEEVHVRTSTGEIIRTNFVVAADGRNSQCRQLFYPSSDFLEDRGYRVYRGHTTFNSRAERISDLSFQTWGPAARFACVPTK